MSLEDLKVKTIWKYEDLEPEFVKKLLSLFTKTSNFYLIVGRRESGKTDFSLLLCELLQNEMKNIATNINLDQNFFTIDHIDDLMTLKDYCLKVPGKKLYILDESARTFESRRSLTQINVEMAKELSILRKYKLSLIMIAPTKKRLDKAFLDTDFLDGFFEKHSKTIADFTDILGHNRGDTIFENIPRTNIPFNTYDIAPFTLYPQQKKNLDILEERDKRLWKYVIEELNWSNAGFLNQMHLNREYRSYLREWMPIVESLKKHPDILARLKTQ